MKYNVFQIGFIQKKHAQNNQQTGRRLVPSLAICGKVITFEISMFGTTRHLMQTAGHAIADDNTAHTPRSYDIRA